MRSTMMDVPLTIASIMRYGTSIFGDREVVTWTGEGTRRRTYAEAGRRHAQVFRGYDRAGNRRDPRHQPGHREKHGIPGGGQAAH